MAPRGWIVRVSGVGGESRCYPQGDAFAHEVPETAATHAYELEASSVSVSCFPAANREDSGGNIRTMHAEGKFRRETDRRAGGRCSRITGLSAGGQRSRSMQFHGGDTRETFFCCQAVPVVGPCHTRRSKVRPVGGHSGGMNGKTLALAAIGRRISTSFPAAVRRVGFPCILPSSKAMRPWQQQPSCGASCLRSASW